MLYQPTINLLPDNKKTNLKTLVQFIFARDLLEMSLLFYTLLATVFIWSWLTLLDEYNNTAQSSTLVSRENSARSQTVRENNNILRQFNRSATGYVVLTPKLTEIISTLPVDIKLSAVNFGQGQKQLLLSGTARTRLALLNYEKIVRGYTWLQNVSTPISQLFEKENISFEIKAELKSPN